MARALAGLTFVALISGVAFGQSTEATPAFTVASVHPSAHTNNPSVYMTGGVLRGGRYDLRKATMLDLIAAAWNIDADRVLGGPNWLELDRFDIAAKAPANTSQDTVKLMLRTLLKERFQLVLHTDTKPAAGFVLSMGKGKHKLKEADGSGTPGCQGVPQDPQPGTVPYALVSCHNVTMEAFARDLHDMAGAYITSPVVDSTGLAGNWDFDLKWTGRALLSMAGADAITIYDAVDRQLGLKLEPQKVAASVLIVDSVDRKPTPDPSTVTAAALPPAPTEFEIADIKPSMPGASPSGRLQPGGRLDLHAIPLKQLIQLAWDISGDDLIVGAPKFLDTARYDVIAKAPGVGGGSTINPQIDIDDVRLMVRALLTDRFKLATHTEDRPIDAYTLVAVKPKLAKADPLGRTGCKEGPAAGTKDPRDTTPILSRLLTCRNMTMAQFGEQLPTLANGYVHSTVTDETGLEGAYDFTLSFSAAGLLNGIPGGPARGGESSSAPPGNSSDAPLPNGALSLPDAVNKQLGLRLEKRRRPVPVLVIDHIEEKPTDN